MLKKPYIIAEAGCNHMGQMEIARELINTAAIYCKADAIKFQKRCPKELLTEEQYNAPHPNPVNSYGDTYGAHREFLEFTVEQHAQLKEWCEEVGITYATSVWDMTSAKEIASLNPEFIKIPSACNNHCSGNCRQDIACEQQKRQKQCQYAFHFHKNFPLSLLPGDSGFDNIIHYNKENFKMQFPFRAKLFPFRAIFRKIRAKDALWSAGGR